MAERVLVTGGAGFIGSHLVEGLLEKGFEVRVLDNLSTGSRQNLAAVMKQINFQSGDILNEDTLGRAMKGCAFVFHEAALRSVPESFKRPLEYNRVNVDGTYTVLKVAKENNVQRVVYAASSSAYGNAEKMPLGESLLPGPLSPYAVSKLGGELYCRMFYECLGLETVCLRYFNVFGERQDPSSQYSSVIPRFISSVLEGRSPVIYGDGMQSRDFTYVKNVVDANLTALRAGERACGEVFNVGQGNSIKVRELLDKVNALLGRSVKPEYQPLRPGDVLHTQADMAKTKRLLGFTPRHSFDVGLKQTVEWFAREPHRGAR
ncbi:MAG: SDR family oxidoreductase [Candidatus Diapherotrites archaeon]|uniref:SDR family oxidoreductase n=1 Tax=Candidatus Iainarchaeum sp. TaxID=3101447 RepID=A0A8T4LCI4_9ARCH|nr:SDR family oxidoreductase [Candidatus Diapherotrites archaeon]